MGAGRPALVAQLRRRGADRLARIGDHRCVDELREQVRGARPGFGVWSSAGGHPQFYMLDMPAIHQVLGPLREYAPALLPAVASGCVRPTTTNGIGSWRRPG